MKFKHKQFPGIAINLPSGGILQFKEGVCEVPDKLIGNIFSKDDLQDLVKIGKVQLIEGTFEEPKKESPKPVAKPTPKIEDTSKEENEQSSKIEDTSKKEDDKSSGKKAKKSKFI